MGFYLFLVGFEVGFSFFSLGFKELFVRFQGSRVHCGGVKRHLEKLLEMVM
jgi:hypothetical protein